MAEVEAGFKIKQSKEEAEKILLEAGFVCTFKTAHTRDIYFGKDVDFTDKTETEVKRSLIRLRGVSLFENLQLLDESFPSDKFYVDFITAHSIVCQIFDAGYDVVLDTEKTDWVYQKGECCHQLQEIKGIGLVDYVYSKDVFGKGYSEEEQFTLLRNQMKDLGFTLEYPLGIDKLRTLIWGEIKFSTNQIGLYEYQE